MLLCDFKVCILVTLYNGFGYMFTGYAGKHFAGKFNTYLQSYLTFSSKYTIAIGHCTFAKVKYKFYSL